MLPPDKREGTPAERGCPDIRSTPARTTSVGGDDAHRHLVDPELLAELRRLLDDHDERDRREALAYEAGYRDGFAAGADVGYGQAEHEMAQAWHAIARRVKAAASESTPAERAALDASAAAGEPCGPKCGRCSRCIRADAVARRGGDYTGGPVPWDGRPVRRTA